MKTHSRLYKYKSTPCDVYEILIFLGSKQIKRDNDPRIKYHVRGKMRQKQKCHKYFRNDVFPFTVFEVSEPLINGDTYTFNYGNRAKRVGDEVNLAVPELTWSLHIL